MLDRLTHCDLWRWPLSAPATGGRLSRHKAVVYCLDTQPSLRQLPHLGRPLTKTSKYRMFLRSARLNHVGKLSIFWISQVIPLLESSPWLIYSARAKQPSLWNSEGHTWIFTVCVVLRVLCSVFILISGLTAQKRRDNRGYVHLKQRAQLAGGPSRTLKLTEFKWWSQEHTANNHQHQKSNTGH